MSAKELETELRNLACRGTNVRDLPRLRAVIDELRLRHGFTYRDMQRATGLPPATFEDLMQDLDEDEAND